MPKIVEREAACTFAAMLTGSQVYGVPNERSDLDLVILVEDKRLFKLLVEFADNKKEYEQLDKDYGENTDSYSLRFGSLNLLVCVSRAAYHIWRRGTDDLRSRAPVTRHEAVEHLSRLRGDIL